MGRINKPNKTTPVSADEFIIYDSEDTSDDKNVTLGQIATFTESQDSTVSGDKTFSGGCAFAKGLIAYGAYTPLPTTVGSYVASYVSPTYGPRLLGYNGSAYQDLSIGSMPTVGTVSMKSLANGDCNFGYNVNIAEDLDVTGDVTASSFVGDGNLLTNIGAKIVSCSTASATVDKAITLTGVPLSDGLTLLVGFTNANTAASITINLNATGAKSLVDKRGNTPDFSNKAGEKVLISYDLTNDRWVLLEAEFYNARMGMPSSSYIDLTLGASGSTYTAPANGIICIGFRNLPANIGIQILNLNSQEEHHNSSAQYVGSDDRYATTLQVKKGDLYTIAYGGGVCYKFRFIYAEGSKV